MPEFGDRSSEKYDKKIEDVECPLCHKAKIRVTFVAGYMSWKVSRIASGAKRTRYFHDPQIKVHSKCPDCRASKEDIRYALEHGGKPISHEERLRRLKESGIPTRIES